MNEKIKTFWKKKKGVIFVVGGAVIVTAASLVLKKKLSTMLDLKGKKYISWNDVDHGTMGLERVLKVLDANKDVGSRFAIYREGPGLDEYVTIMLSDNVEIV